MLIPNRASPINQQLCAVLLIFYAVTITKQMQLTNNSNLVEEAPKHVNLHKRDIDSDQDIESSTPEKPEESSFGSGGIVLIAIISIVIVLILASVVAYIIYDRYCKHKRSYKQEYQAQICKPIQEHLGHHHPPKPATTSHDGPSNRPIPSQMPPTAIPETSPSTPPPHPLLVPTRTAMQASLGQTKHHGAIRHAPMAALPIRNIFYHQTESPPKNSRSTSRKSDTTPQSPPGTHTSASTQGTGSDDYRHKTIFSDIGHDYEIVGAEVLASAYEFPEPPTTTKTTTHKMRTAKNSPTN